MRYCVGFYVTKTKNTHQYFCNDYDDAMYLAASLFLTDRFFGDEPGELYRDINIVDSLENTVNFINKDDIKEVMNNVKS